MTILYCMSVHLCEMVVWQVMLLMWSRIMISSTAIETPPHLAHWCWVTSMNWYIKNAWPQSKNSKETNIIILHTSLCVVLLAPKSCVLVQGHHWLGQNWEMHSITRHLQHPESSCTNLVWPHVSSSLKSLSICCHPNMNSGPCRSACPPNQLPERRVAPRRCVLRRFE